jgi:hypothetical protein
MSILFSQVHRAGKSLRMILLTDNAVGEPLGFRLITGMHVL